MTLSDFDSVAEAINTIDDILHTGIQKPIKKNSGHNKILLEKNGYYVILGRNPNGDFVITSYDHTKKENAKKKKSSCNTLA